MLHDPSHIIQEPVSKEIVLNEIPWHEMNVNDELTLRCSSNWARGLEDSLRKTIYQWRHMPGDMVVKHISGLHHGTF